jgi:hypothetical protein
MKNLLLTALAALALMAFGGTVATAADPNSIVVPAQEQNYGQLGANWWKWALSIPYQQNPQFDQTGASCGLGQNGGVWFLAGTPGGSVTRSCTIPAGKTIFFPIVNINNDYPCPDPNFQPAPGQSLHDFLTDGAVFVINHAHNLNADLDGVDIPIVASYRGTSNMYSFTGDPSLTVFDPCITGSQQKAVSDGYWLLLAPLSPGTHTLSFGAMITIEDFSFSTEATYNLTVQ